jgi:TPP-dependent pyruvate/acetoin dehydrogenase alpha subunit
LTVEELDEAKKAMQAVVKDAVKFADESPDPPANLAKVRTVVIEHQSSTF